VPVPPILAAAADYKGMTFAMIVPACFMIVPWSYALCVNCVPAYRDVVDSAHEKESSRRPSQADEEAGEGPSDLSWDRHGSDTPMVNLNKPLPEVSKFEHVATADETDKERSTH
jgi:FHS family L-fucose permease-like MFS transporter